MSGLRIGSLFSGAGGLDLAVEAMFGGRTVWHCENDAAASRVLACRWPGVPNFGDIMRVDWSAVEPVDILAGGFPCQDVSAAGRRAGLRHGTRSGTFHHLIQAVTVLRPALVVLENTFGLMTADGDEWPDEVTALAAEAERWGRIKTLIDCKIRAERKRGQRDKAWWHRKQTEKIRASRRHRIAVAEFRRQRLRLVPRAIGTVLGRLAACGYDAQWVCLRASDVGAPHSRERIFVIAHAEELRGANESYGGDSVRQSLGAIIGTSDRDSERPTTARISELGRTSRQLATTPDAKSIGRREGRPESARLVGGSDAAVSSAGPVELLPTPQAFDQVDFIKTPEQIAAHREGGGCCRNLRDVVVHELLSTPQARDYKGVPADGFNLANLCRDVSQMDAQWGKYEPAIRRWESLTRPAPSPTEPNTKGNPRLSAAFSEWMMGWPAGWVTDIEGISRNDQLRIIGNGVVPQQAVAALQFLLSIEEAI